MKEIFHKIAPGFHKPIYGYTINTHVTIEKNKYYGSIHILMKQLFRTVRDVGGQKMIAVPDSIPLGNSYEGVVDIVNHSFTFYLVRSTRPFVNNPTIVKETPADRPTIQEESK